jgi:multiple sugar transport system substrate-binding protein
LRTASPDPRPSGSPRSRSRSASPCRRARTGCWTPASSRRRYTGVYSIWKFAKNREAAEKFLADVCIDSEQAILASNLFNFPSFPGAIPLKQIYETAAADAHLPRGKYSILATIASKYTRNVGYPGYSNAAVQEVLDTFLIPRMFAQVSQGKTSAAESVRSTAKEMKRIWSRWRGAGKI